MQNTFTGNATINHKKKCKEIKHTYTQTSVEAEVYHSKIDKYSNLAAALYKILKTCKKLSSSAQRKGSFNLYLGNNSAVLYRSSKFPHPSL